MTYKMHSVENCLIILSENTSSIDPRDKNLISSLAKQVLNNIGLTNRQLSLAKKKIDEYRLTLEQHGINLERAKQTVLLPIRQLDRSRWIRFDTSDDILKITIRFLFAKKLISALEQLKKHIPKDDESNYDAESKVRTFDYTESNLYNIVNIFKPYDFDIDDDILNIYNQLCELNPEQYIPGVYNGEIKNLPATAVKMLHDEIGEINTDNLILYKDRSLRYGLNYFDQNQLNESGNKISDLAFKIASRSVPSIAIESPQTTIESIVLALDELQRFPLLIVIPSQTPDIIVDIHKRLKNIVSPEETTVMFRLDNTDYGSPINAWIKENKLNNSLGSTIKIVYTIDNKIPKPILRSGWMPRTILSFDQSSMLVTVRRILNWYSDQDLIIHYEKANGGIITNYFEVEKI